MSTLLVIHPDSLSSLLPSTLLDNLHALISQHSLDNAALLVDNHRRALEQNITLHPHQAEELAYVYQVLGFQCFSETLFEDAGNHLFNGALDPRLLVSYYPDLCGSLFSKDDQIDVFAGVADHMPSEASVGDIIRNYSPHLSPNTREAPPAVELKSVLITAAREMLLNFLAKSRTRARVERRSEDVRSDVTRVVDTVLAKLYAQLDRPQDLRTLFSESNDVVLSEIEPSLRDLGLYSPLADLYRQREEHEKLLELYAGIAEGEYIDSDIQHPLDNILATLESFKVKDRGQQTRWGLWILKKGDLDRGMKLLIPSETGKRRDRDRDKEEDLALLEQITEAHAEAGRRYLEYLVLMKRNMSPDLHTRLALSCIDELLKFIHDEPTSKLWRAKTSSYSSTRPPTHPPSSSKPAQIQQSFLSYFASTTPDSPSKRTRLKAVFMLAGSAVYDAKRVKAHLEEGLGETSSSNLLALESAILDGKLGNHSAALSTLVHDLRDSTSAEAYCALGGEVVPAKIALGIVESERVGRQPTAAGLELGVWYWGLFESPKSGAGAGAAGKREKVGSGKVSASSPALVRQKSVREDVKRALLMDLAKVYMSDVAIGADRATRLLDAQGVNLDVLEVVQLVPPEWSISSLSTFLARYFRRTLHTRYETMIVKNVAAGQNIAVRDNVYGIMHEQGYFIEESDSGDEEEMDEKEKQAIVMVEQEGEREATSTTTTTRASVPVLEKGEREVGLGLILGAEERGGEEEERFT